MKVRTMFLALAALAPMAAAATPGWDGLVETPGAEAPTLDVAVTARLRASAPGAQVLTLGLEGPALDQVKAVRYRVGSSKAPVLDFTIEAPGPGQRVRFRADLPLKLLPQVVLAEVRVAGSDELVPVTGLDFSRGETRSRVAVTPRYRKIGDRLVVQEAQVSWAPSEDGSAAPRRVAYAVRHDQAYDEAAPFLWTEVPGPSARDNLAVRGLWARSGATWYGTNEESYLVWVLFEYPDGLVENQAIWLPGAVPADLEPAEKEALEEPREPDLALRGRSLDQGLAQ